MLSTWKINRHKASCAAAITGSAQAAVAPRSGHECKKLMFRMIDDRSPRSAAWALQGRLVLMHVHRGVNPNSCRSRA